MFIEYIYAIVITLLYSMACLLLGLVFLRRLFLKKSFSIWAILSSSFLLGLGILASLWLFLGLGSFLKKPLVWTIIIGIIILCSPFVYSTYYDVMLPKVKGITKSFRNLSLIWKIILLGLIFLILSYGLLALTTLPKGDAVAFYMVLPKIMATSERLRPQPNYYNFSQIGLMGEMHFAALMSIGNAAAAQFLLWTTSLSIAGLLISLGAMLKLSNRGQIITLIILFTTSTFTLYISGGKVDVFGAAFGLATYFWVLEAFHNKKINITALVLTGLFMGFAFVAKLPSLVAILPGVLLIIAWGCFSAHKKQPNVLILKFIKSVLIVTVFFLLAVLPHLIKNWVLFKEPLAPFILFYSNEWEWAEPTWFSRENIHYILKTYPLALIFGQYPMQGGNLSPFILAFAPLILFVKGFWSSKLKNPFLLIFSAFLVGLIFWNIFRPGVLAPRYILATLLLTIPLVAKGADFLLVSQYKILKFMVTFGLLMAITSLLIFNSQLLEKQLSAIKIGKLETANFSYRSSEFINQSALPGDRVFVAGYYVYFFKSDILQCLSVQEERDNPPPLVSPEIWQYYWEHGFKEVVIQTISYPNASQIWNIDKKPDWLDIQAVYKDDFVTIYSLKNPDIDSTPRCSCTSSNNKAWDVRCSSGIKEQ